MKTFLFLAAAACLFPQASRLLGDSAGAPDGVTGASPDYVVTSWHIQDGLPSDRVRSVVQTRDGYIWVATFNGLARFDGLHFQRFSDANTPELRNSLANWLFEDSAARLWIGSDTGEITWHDSSGFHPLATPTNWFNSPVDRFSEAADGALYILNRNGLILFARHGTVRAVLGEPPEKPYGGLASDPEGNVWAVHYGGNMAHLRDGVEVPGELPPPDGYRSLTTARHGGVWVRDGSRLRRWDNGKWVEDRGAGSWTTIRDVALYETGAGDVWISTVGDGVFIVAPDGTERHINRANGLGHNLVTCVTQDRENNIWVGTGGGGLELLRPRVLTMVSPPDTGQHPAILSVSPARDGGVWIGTEGAGVYKLRNGQFTKLGPAGHTPAEDVRTTLQDRSGQLWVGTQGAGLLGGNGTNLQPARTTVEMPLLFYALYEDSAGAIWMGTQNGIVLFQNGHWSRLGRDLYRTEVRCITQTPDGAVWIGMRGGGIARYEAGKFTQILRADGLPYEYIWSLFADKDGSVWIGTPGEGLIRWRNGVFNHFTTRSGLPSDFICNIQADSSGNLWIGSYGGIIKVSKSELERCARDGGSSLDCTVLDMSDGLTSLELAGGNQPSACATSDGRLWFATSDGLAVVDPARIQRNLRPPPVRIEEVLADGKPVPLVNPSTAPDGMSASAAVVAPPGSGSIEFRYTALSFSAPQRVRFRYKLEKIDSAWIDAGSRRAAHYSHLPPKEYRFRVIACNNDGVWNNDGAAISVTILPYFWETWWFAPLCRVSGVLLAGAIILSFVRQRHRRRVETLERAQLVERERGRIARDLHDDLGSGLTDIGMTSALASDSSVPISEAREYFQEISQRSRDMVNALDEIVWAVNPKNDDLNSLTSYFCQFTERFLRLTPIACRFEIPDGLPNHPLNAEQRHNLFLAFKEALQNTVKHSGAASLHLNISVTDKTLQLALKDDGCGFAEGAPAPGADGLRNMRERLRQLGGHCAISSALNKGTRVVFTIPFAAPPAASA